MVNGRLHWTRPIVSVGLPPGPNGHVEVVKTLLAAGAEVDKADNDGETPLYGASHNGHVEVVKTLLAAEAEVDKVDRMAVGLHCTGLSAQWAPGGGEDPPGSRGGGGQGQ